MADDKAAFYASVFDAPAWKRADWYQTALCVEESGENPPLLGLIFGDQDAGRSVFRALMKRIGRSDEKRELRISLVEGDIPGQKPGYTVHIGGDPAAVAARAKEEGASFELPAAAARGAWVRMKPAEGSTLLAEFKASYEKHGSVMLAPFFGKGSEMGPTLDFCVSTVMQFRNVADVKADGGDLDAPLIAKKG